MQYNATLHKLSNGVTVILDPMVAATTAITVGFKTGSRHEKPSQHGITHFCEHMLCKGTTRFPNAIDIDNYVADNAGTYGAHTGHEHIELYGTILAENTELLLDVFADQLQNSVFDEEQIERERTVVADELRRAMDDGGRIRTNFITKNVFVGDFSVYRTLGTFDNIASFTKKQMKMFMARRFSGKNCVVCVSGRIDNPEKLLGVIERRFSWLPALDVQENAAVSTYTPAVAHRSQPVKKNANVAVLVPKLYPLSAENRFRRMCVGRFNLYLEQELFRVLRTENGLVYGVESESFDVDGVGVNGFSARTSPESVARLMKLMAQTARGACTTKPITDEFLSRLQNRYRLGDAMWLESPLRRRDRLMTEWYGYGTLYDYHDIVRQSNSITAADVKKYTRGYFDGPISIVSTGANFDADVMDIWHKNFGTAAPTQNIITTKDEKCH